MLARNISQTQENVNGGKGTNCVRWWREGRVEGGEWRQSVGGEVWWKEGLERQGVASSVGCLRCDESCQLEKLNERCAELWIWNGINTAMSIIWQFSISNLAECEWGYSWLPLPIVINGICNSMTYWEQLILKFAVHMKKVTFFDFTFATNAELFFTAI